MNVKNGDFVINCVRTQLVVTNVRVLPDTFAKTGPLARPVHQCKK